MSDKAPGITQRKPDCVTEIRKGNTVLTVSGYFKQDATETAADKMAKVLKAERAITLDGGSQRVRDATVHLPLPGRNI